MKASELRERTTEELQDQEVQLSEKLFALRLQMVTGQLEDTSKVRSARRDLARVMTVMQEKGTKAKA